MKTPGSAPGEGAATATDAGGHAASTSLRLVRLRLVLALIAAAAVPVAVGLVVPSFVDGGRPDQGLVMRAGSSLSTGLAAELERSRSALLLLAANPSAIRLAEGKGSAADARTDLQAISSVVGSRVAVASIVDAKGRERLRLENGKIATASTAPVDHGLLDGTLALSPGAVYRSSPFDAAGGAPLVTIATPLVSSGKDVGLVRFDLSLSGLLVGAEGNVAAQGGYSMIVDAASGTVVADTRAEHGSSSGAPAIARPDQLLAGIVQRAGEAWTTLISDGWSVGYAPLATAVPGFDDWAVMVALPAGSSNAPVVLLGVLAVLVLVLVVLTAWMSRQVLLPAAELERSRAELATALKAARQDALRDSLTGLGNHRAFHEELEHQLATSRRHGVPVALVLLDLDDFKKINDTSGHAAGDGVLAMVGTFLQAHTRGGDTAFRIGGDEFAIVMPHTDAEGALAGARRILGMSLEPVAGTVARKGISFSAGVSAAPALATSRAELYAQADAALLWCKRHGRTSVAAYDAEKHTLDAEIATTELSQAVARVAAERALRPVFQPIVDVATGAVWGFEGLIRPASGSGFEDALSMFAAAERCGRTVELDQACLEVISAAATRVAPERVVSINLSPRSLEAPEFSARALVRQLERLGLAPSRVVIELTEREAVDDLQVLRANLVACQRAGMRIAADDVGSGNAGLRLLSQIHFDIVKIDLSLVHDGAAREPSLAVLRSLVDLAKRWGSTVVAEGVETPDQLRVLRSLDVTAAQGYLLARPSDDVTMESVDLEDILSASPSRPGWASVRAASA